MSALLAVNSDFSFAALETHLTQDRATTSLELHARKHLSIFQRAMEMSAARKADADAAEEDDADAAAEEDDADAAEEDDVEGVDTALVVREGADEVQQPPRRARVQLLGQVLVLDVGLREHSALCFFSGPLRRGQKKKERERGSEMGGAFGRRRLFSRALVSTIRRWRAWLP